MKFNINIVKSILDATNGGKKIFEEIIGKSLPLVGNIQSPLRDDRNPSFGIRYYNGKWWYKDFGNGKKGGDAINFYAEYHGIDLKEAIKKLSDFYFQNGDY